MRTRPVPVPLGRHGGAATLPIDLSASLNPLGPSPSAVRAARAAELARYPEVGAASLARAAAHRHGLPDEAVVPVAGGNAGLWLALLAFAGPGDTCVALGPCFGEYRRCAAATGARYVELACPALDLAWTADAVAAALRERPAVCLLGNPANPSGSSLAAAVLRQICADHAGTLFVVDEAFAPLACGATSLIEGGLPASNVIVVRSLTKELGMPGLRMGYVVAQPGRAEALRGLQPAWPLSAPAIAAAVAGMGDLDHVAAGRRVGREHVRLMAAAVAATGARTFPGAANYLLCHAPGLAGRLAARGIALRDCGSFGLPDHARLAAPAPADLDAVLRAIHGR